jgi:uncharacterized protein (DUF488 family)
MAQFDLFSIGHSNIPAQRFTAMLRDAGVDAVADVRSTPASRFCPWFSAKNLAALLAREGIGYLSCGGELGGRPRDPTLYRDGVADYEAMAQQDEFQSGLERLLADAARGRLCMMCAEREPLDCHRCLLVARELTARRVAVGHILHDGTVEPHAATEARLLALDGKGNDAAATGDLFGTGLSTTGLSTTGLGKRLAAAYRRRARAVAYRARA